MIEGSMVPKFAEANEGIRWFKVKGRWIDAVARPDYKPSLGTLIFFDWEQDGVADHVGVVEVCRGGMVYTIEGNNSDMVANRYYLHGSSEIMGYGVVDILGIFSGI